MANQLIPVPETSDTIIIFPRNPRKQKFNSDFYNADITQGRASNEEIQKVLADIYLSRKPFATTVKIIAYIILFLILLALIGIAVVVFLDGSFELAILRYVVFFTIIVLVLTLLSQIITRNTKKQRKAAEGALENHRPEFASRGLNWIVPQQYPRWVELHKDYLFFPQEIQPQNIGVPLQQNNDLYQPPALHQD